MSTKNIDDAVKATVETFVAKAFMFSAFDVTKTVRADLGKSVFVSHNDVRDIVSSMYANGLMDQYVRDLAKMGSSAEAWVYYHPISDINDYDSDWINSNPNQDGMKADKDSSNASATMPPLSFDVAVGDTTLQVYTKDSLNTLFPNATFSDGFIKAIDSYVPPTSVNTKTNDCKEKLHDLTKEGRLNIPKSILEKAGIPTTDMFCLQVVGNTIVIANPNFSGSFDYIKYADKTGRIRLSLTDINPITTIGAYNHRYKINYSPNKEVIIVEATF